MSKDLVSYFSASGVTKRKVEGLAKEVNGDLFEIVPKEIYMAEDLNWNNRDSRSSVEIKDKELYGYSINSNLDSRIDEYDSGICYCVGCG